TVGDAFFFVVAALSLFALPRFARRAPAARLFVLLTGVGLLLVPLELYGLSRFKVPLAPFLALGAAATLDALWTSTAKRPPLEPLETSDARL
ncbi:MAG: hypothetical protein JWL83_3434, partial [Actinomycetia bacterium]|nr:hypothetical protein [Actinomycetes bacterium]